jgi:hypothetical protein
LTGKDNRLAARVIVRARDRVVSRRERGASAAAERVTDMQLDRVVAPAGLISSAKTYSLVRDAGGFYMIFTGPAMGNAPAKAGVAGAIGGAILDRMADKRATQIAENEAKIRQSSAAALKDTKHSRYVAKASIKEVVFKSGALYGAFPVVVVKADKKVKLHFREQDEATVRQFFAGLSPA